MKECYGKKVLIVKVAQNDPLDSSSQKNLPGGQQDQRRRVEILSLKDLITLLCACLHVVSQVLKDNFRGNEKRKKTGQMRFVPTNIVLIFVVE